MIWNRMTWGLPMLALLAFSQGVTAQTDASQVQDEASYRFSLAVDEVSLTFHAVDAQGLPINDLKIDELRLLDNGRAPRRIVAFQLLKNYPIRAGILMDTSESMTGQVRHDRAISIEYAQRLLRQRTGQAFVMDFGYVSKIAQPWTSDPIALTAGIRQVIAGRDNPLAGTAMFDAIFRACYSEFGKIDHAASANFVLLFSDGEDNASHTSLREAVDMCQRSNTAIYAFRSEPKPELFSSGPKNLAELAAETGGRVFNGEDSDAGIDLDLHTIEAELSNQYRLIYNPAELKHDGVFHQIELSGPERVDTIRVRSGYYAPEH
ncbi:MAG TPA: VWA domain-containing protein [Terracidiphilus sp.]|jgi:VWFA-related protein